ncbi:MAG TPA: nitroreductase [Sporolactobacillaceae bacterium]|nr:nitroreductase [Sporolactobacillaceae bacterium]
MDIIEAIKTRRSIPKVQDTIPNKELIMEVLEASQWAPNHYRTEPWSFEVLTGSGRDKLGAAYGRIQVDGLGAEIEESERQAAYEKGLAKARRAPVVIVIKVQPSDQKNVVFVEEVAATACAVQNMLLTANSLGLGAMWRSGSPSYHAIMNETFGMKAPGFVFGFLYIGFPIEGLHLHPPKKRPLNEVVQWTDHI